MNEKYLAAFCATLTVLLGGMEMAEEFFDWHVDVSYTMLATARRCEEVCTCPNTAAESFFEKVVRPILRSDRRRIAA